MLESRRVLLTGSARCTIIGLAVGTSHRTYRLVNAAELVLEQMY